jgi:hypothetical protein
MVVIETLGEAFDAKWGVRMRCGRSDERLSRSARCGNKGALDMATLAYTRGRRFPLARLASRLRCPSCGDLKVKILFDVPGQPIPVWISQNQYQRRT